MAEAGVADAEAYTFFGLVAPTGTPAPIITRLNTLINEGLRTPEIQTSLTKAGSEVHTGSPADFSAYVATQHRRWVEVGKAAHVTID